MSVIRPKPPTDPILHRPPAVWPEPAAAERFAAAVARLEDLRGGVPADADVAGALVRAYGTRAAPAPRRESVLFAILDTARRVRETVDRLVVVADRAERAVVDLLVATCCHPFHDQLARAERGGRPRVTTLGEGDDQDRVLGVIDLLGIRAADALADRWALCAVGGCRAAATQRYRTLLGELAEAREAATMGIATAGDAFPGDGVSILLPGSADPGDACFAPLLPAAVAGIDVVRLLEGMEAMHRRFREARGDANPVLTFVAVERAFAAAAPARRRLLPPAHWPGLETWGECLSPADPAGEVTSGFVTAVTVGECRRRLDDAAGGAAPGAAAGPDMLHLPRADEHAVGQLLELLRLARRLGTG